MWRTADGNSCQVGQSVSQERGRREKSHRFSRDFRRFRDHFSDPGCPKNRRKALPERVFADFLGFPQSPHPLLRLLRLLFFFLSFFSLPPRTENSVCRFAGLQSGGKKCGYRARLVGKEMMIPPSSTNFLPFLSGSGEKRQLCQSRLTGLTSEQPEFAARQTAAPKICTT